MYGRGDGGFKEMNKKVKTGKASKALGPYFQAIITNGFAI
jgi:hypothetical protein